MGGTHDAAVIAVGQCGFGLDATPTAIANMQAVTDRLWPVTARLFGGTDGRIDIANAMVIKLFLAIPLLSAGTLR